MRAVSRSRAMCEWDDSAGDGDRIRALLARGESGTLPPFHLLSQPGISAGEQRACSELWMRDRLAAAQGERAAMDLRFGREERGKIRLGYLSSDFHDHATALLLIEMLEAHDHTRFELHAYSYGDSDGKAMRQRLLGAFDKFHDISALTDGQAAQAIHRDGIDILVDLKGYTQNTRTSILMLRPAPVQVNFLGYPGTLGAGICDYIITDPFMTPAGSEADYAESFAYMPHSYQPHGRHAPVGPKPSRAGAGLPESGFVFCCFNQAYKFTPDMFSLWCRLLQAVPGSVLWLLESALARGNLRNEALNRGISPERLIFAPDLPQTEHLGRLQLAGLVLDTAPCGAHTTASDALWAGVPVVTCPGGTFPSRVAGSLLHAAGLGELIASSPEEYFEIAYKLAACAGRMDALTRKLALSRPTAPLFDAGQYTRDIEQLYETMWQRHLAGLPHAAIGAIPVCNWRASPGR